MLKLALLASMAALALATYSDPKPSYGDPKSSYGDPKGGYGGPSYGDPKGSYGGPSYGGPSYGGPSYGGPTYGGPNPYEIKDLIRAARDAEAETDFLIARKNMLLAQKTQLYSQIDAAEALLNALASADDVQDGRIVDVKDWFARLADYLADLVAAIAANDAIASRNDAVIASPLTPAVDALTANNAQQTADLYEGRSLLESSIDLIYKQLAVRTEESSQEINSLKEFTKDLAGTINFRNCQTYEQEVQITGEGAEVVSVPYGFNFNGQVPDVYCGLQGVSTHLGKSFSAKAGGYGGGYGGGYSGGYAPRQRFTQLGFSVNCKPLQDYVDVVVDDVSRGDNILVESVTVAIKACTMGPVAK